MNIDRPSNEGHRPPRNVYKMRPDNPCFDSHIAPEISQVPQGVRQAVGKPATQRRMETDKNHAEV